jgi:hypothetical protein
MVRTRRSPRWIVKIFVSHLKRMEVGNLVGPERMQECVKAGGYGLLTGLALLL